jgi:VIT1/CCC1 family predicted Fe2+/Mn2+ transporter
MSVQIVQEEVYKSHRANWLRAAVLGANDGIVSTASLMVGVATATNDQTVILTAGIAGLVAGALSMAAGEYVSVSSQRDSERADIAIKRRRIQANPAQEMVDLAAVYESRGLSPQLAREVAKELHGSDPLGAHARDCLGIDSESLANPWQAAIASAAAFSVGAILPIVAAIIWHGTIGIWAIVIVAMLALAVSGAVGAFVGGGNRIWAALRVLIGGGLAMAITALIGHILGVNL